MDKAFFMLMKRGGVSVTALSEAMNTPRVTLYSWKRNGTPGRPGDRILIEVFRSAIKACIDKGTLPVPPDEVAADKMNATVKRRIHAEIPATLRSALRKK